MNGEHGSPRPEPGIGSSLQTAREERGLTLRQVEERTKIRARYLQDLERENFGVLPAVYVLGSLKTYANHLGLDGEALSADLKRRLEPEETEALPEEPTKTGNARDTKDEYEASPLLTVGFDHLFLGLGLVLIFTLAVMTLVFALATNDEPAVSQIREPAVPGTPSEIALAGNVLERPDRQPQAEEPAPNAGGEREDGRSANERDDKPENGPATSKDKDEDRPEQRPEDASSQESLFEDVKFVPISPSSPPATSLASSAAPASAAATASATASPDATASPPPPNQTPAPASPEPTSPAPASPAPASPAPAGPAPTTDTPAATAPAATAPAATVSTDAPAAAAVPPEVVPPEAAGSQATPGSATAEPAPTVTQPVPVTSGAPEGQGPLGSRPDDLNVSRLVDGIDARVEDAVGPVR